MKCHLCCAPLKSEVRVKEYKKNGRLKNTSCIEYEYRCGTRHIIFDTEPVDSDAREDVIKGEDCI